MKCVIINIFIDENICMDDSIDIFLSGLHSKVLVALPFEKIKKIFDALAGPSWGVCICMFLLLKSILSMCAMC